MKSEISISQNISRGSCSSNDSSSKSKIKNNKTKKKILIVDDNQFINDSIKYVIDSIIKERNMDFEVIQCCDGIDMIKLVVEDQRDGCLIKCVLTDENMEYINGSEAIKILRNLEKNKKIKNLKLFSVSSEEDTNTLNMIKNIGTDHIISKPVSKITIINCFEDHNIFQ